MSKKRVTRTTVKPTKSKIESIAKAKEEKSFVYSDSSDKMLFNKTTYTYILGGIALMAIGFFLMAGGHNSDPNVFDENVIYSTRRTLIAPIFILAGLVVQVVAIFKK